MSVVTVQLGQCGNQLGEALCTALAEEASRAHPALADATRQTFFDEVPTRARSTAFARSVLVDTEPRVVERCLNEGGPSWSYRPANVVLRQGGAANNWAFGCFHHGPSVAETLEDVLRSEVERCDRLEGFVALHSVAGGTGSGVGSFALQLLRDSFPSASIVSASVWPFETGEVSVQSYNTALSLTALFEYTDMSLVFENARYLDICRMTLRDPQPSLRSLNRAICEALVRCTLPCGSSASPLSSGCPLLRVSGRLCAHPAYRLVVARSLPQVSAGARSFHTETWAGLQRRIVAMSEAGSVADQASSAEAVLGGGPARASGAPPGGMASAASAAFLWGIGALSVPLDGLRVLPLWRFGLEPMQVYADTHEVGGFGRSLGLLSSCRSLASPLATASTKASAMFRACAYVHQYEQYGLSRDELAQAILHMAQVQSDYDGLCAA